MQFVDDPEHQVNLKRVLSEQIHSSNGSIESTTSNRFYPNLVGRIVRCSKCDYEVLKEIGHPGAYGRGWEVKRYNLIEGNTEVSERAFLKSYFLPKGYEDDEYTLYLKMVLRELDIVGRLAQDKAIVHPNIVKYVDSLRDATVHDGSGKELPPIACIITELVENGTELLDWWEDWDHACKTASHSSGLDIDGVARFFFRELMRGVDHAHRHGAFHYDIKLENIMVSADGRSLKLVDFGMGKRFQQKELSEWIAKEREHSIRAALPQYIAPEARQLEAGDTTLLGPVDLWCCGNVLATLTLYRTAREAGVDCLRALKSVCRITATSWEQHMTAKVKVKGIEVTIAGILAPRFDPAQHADGPDLQGLLAALLRPIPRERISAAAALEHPWLSSALPCAVPPDVHAFLSRRPGPAPAPAAGHGPGVAAAAAAGGRSAAMP